MDHPNGLKAVGPTIKLLEWCRGVGVQVCYVFLVAISREADMMQYRRRTLNSETGMLKGYKLI